MRRGWFIFLLMAAGPLARAEEPRSTLECIHLARVALGVPDMAAARAHALRAVELDPAYAGAWKQLGRVLMLDRRYADAWRAIDTAIELDDRDPDLPRWRASLLRDYAWERWSDGAAEEALALFNEAFGGALDRREAALRSAAFAFAEKGLVLEAAGLLRQWADDALLAALAREAMSAGRLECAEAVHLALGARGVELPRATVTLAFIRMLLGRCMMTDEALVPDGLDAVTRDMARETVRVCAPDAAATEEEPPADAAVTDALENAAQRRLAAADPGHALRLFTRVFDRDPNRMSYLGAVRAAEAARGPADAAELAIRIAERATRPAVIFGARGKAARLSGDPAAAATNFEQSLAVEPDQPAARLEYFHALLALGRRDAALAQVDWMAGREADRQVGGRAALAEMWSAMGDHVAALEFWEDLCRRYPNSAYFAVERARALVKIGRNEDALAALAPLNQRAPTAASLEWAARILMQQGRAADAIDYAERALELEYTPELLQLRDALRAESKP